LLSTLAGPRPASRRGREATDSLQREGGAILATKYGPKAKTKVKKAMHEFKAGKWKSGKTVKGRKQAVVIGLSQARKAGGRVPSKKS
jgi:hypothetical protein